MANSRVLRSFGFEVLLHSNAQTDRDFPGEEIFGANNRLHFKIMEAARSLDPIVVGFGRSNLCYVRCKTPLCKQTQQKLMDPLKI